MPWQIHNMTAEEIRKLTRLMLTIKFPSARTTPPVRTSKAWASDETASQTLFTTWTKETLLSF